VLIIGLFKIMIVTFSGYSDGENNCAKHWFVSDYMIVTFSGSLMLIVLLYVLIIGF
jgi:hypothetical protein